MLYHQIDDREREPEREESGGTRNKMGELAVLESPYDHIASM